MKAANICNVGVTEREERDKRAESSVKKLIPKASKLGIRNSQIYRKNWRIHRQVYIKQHALKQQMCQITNQNLNLKFCQSRLDA